MAVRHPARAPGGDQPGCARIPGDRAASCTSTSWPAYRTAGMLLRGGMPAVSRRCRCHRGLLRADSRAAFAAATQAVTRRTVTRRCAMERNGLTTAVAARMLRVGERSGNMGEMMERIAAFCDEELARWVAVATR